MFSGYNRPEKHRIEPFAFQNLLDLLEPKAKRKCGIRFSSENSIYVLFKSGFHLSRGGLGHFQENLNSSSHLTFYFLHHGNAGLDQLWQMNFSSLENLEGLLIKKER